METHLPFYSTFLYSKAQLYISLMEDLRESNPPLHIAQFGLDYRDIEKNPGLIEESGLKVYEEWELSKEISRSIKGGGHFWERPVTMGEVGCTYAHINMWRDAYQRNYEAAIITEVDIELKKGWYERVHELYEELNGLDPDWDMLYLGRILQTKWFHDTPFKGSFVIPGYSYTTHAYMVTRKGIGKMLELRPHKNIIPADELLPALYCKHPRDDINKLFGLKDFKCYALPDGEEVINQLPKTRGGTDTEDSPFVIESKTASPSEEPDIPTVKDGPSAIIKEVSVATFQSYKVKVLIVGTDMTDGLKRNIASLEHWGYDYKVLGLDDDWRGGYILENPGAGQKVSLFTKELEIMKKKGGTDNLILIFLDGYDQMATTPEEYVVEEFLTLETRMLFNSERPLWPDPNLKDRFPVAPTSFRFLNSGGFMGYFDDIYNIATSKTLKDSEDDQLYYQHQFLSGKWDMKLDYYCKIFQCTAHDTSTKDLNTNWETRRLYNNETKTTPMFIHGNGWLDSKILYNRFEAVIGPPHSARKIEDDGHNTIFIAAFIQGDEDAGPFLNGLLDTNYGLNQIGLCIVNQRGKTLADIESFKRLNKDKLKEIIIVESSEERCKDFNIRKETMEICHSKGYDRYFMVEDRVKFLRRDTLEHLIRHDRTIIAPLILGKASTQLACNFWTDVDARNNWYQDHPMHEIIKIRDQPEVWNLPHIDTCYLIKTSLLPEIWDFYKKGYRPEQGTDMAFCANLRERQDFMYLDNTNEYGVFTK